MQALLDINNISCKLFRALHKDIIADTKGVRVVVFGVFVGEEGDLTVLDEIRLCNIAVVFCVYDIME